MNAWFLKEIDIAVVSLVGGNSAISEATTSIEVQIEPLVHIF
jgi:hypothetical protein